MATSTIKTPNVVAVSGITAGTSITSLEAQVYRCGEIVSGYIVFKTNVAITTNNYVIASGLPSTAYRLQVVGTCVGGTSSQLYKATRFAIYQGNLISFYSNTIEAGTTWCISFSYIEA